MKEKRILIKNRDNTLIKEFIWKFLDDYGLSFVDITRIPIGTKVTVRCLRARKLQEDSHIQRKLMSELKERFGLDNIILDIQQVKNPYLDPHVVAYIADQMFKKYGVMRFKVIGYTLVNKVMNAGAKGVEILFSGLIPGTLHRTWPFRGGYLPKSGQPAKDLILRAKRQVQMKNCVIGVQVFILPGDAKLPDEIEIRKIEE